jgi:hypothetical protein
MSKNVAAYVKAQARSTSQTQSVPSPLPQIDVVISVCARRDVDVWQVAARHIVSFIAARRYVIIVPDADLAIFCACTPSVFEVLPESRYTAEFSGPLAAIVQGAQERTGWYLQQFLKFAFLRSVPPDNLVLIWDADTVPLRPLHFVNADGSLNFYRSEEFHAPYFSAIAKLTGQERITDRSFIAQCFPVYGRWAAELFKHIELRHAMGWADALVACIDFAQASGFSEYETLGTFLSHTHPSEMRLAQGAWDRRGRAYTGEAHMLHWPYLRRSLQGLDFLAYEKWDQPFEAYPGLLRRLLRGLFIAKGQK